METTMYTNLEKAQKILCSLCDTLYKNSGEECVRENCELIRELKKDCIARVKVQDDCEIAESSLFKVVYKEIGENND